MAERTRILLATNNPGKVREFRRLIADARLEVVTPAEVGISLDVDETGSTYAENATLKARAFAEAGNCLALADDSGIEVDALEGRPGLYSARYGGAGLDDEGRTALLLTELDGVAPPHRTARYRAVVALAWPDRESVELFEGIQEGTVGFAPEGSGGFGYDPVFLVDEIRTQAQISDEEKDDRSHRGKAVRAAVAWLGEHCL
ncbi:MAG: RdgB/HAM1 family non-canonical purine NTP pyrophosphatase [Dehalococcoidia bacterium]